MVSDTWYSKHMFKEGSHTSISKGYSVVVVLLLSGPSLRTLVAIYMQCQMAINNAKMLVSIGYFLVEIIFVIDPTSDLEIQHLK